MARCDSYVEGQCTWGACQLLDWVQDGWGDAYQWADNATASGLLLSASPVLGSVVVYGPDPAYSDLGHVAAVTAVFPTGQFEVREMNYVAPGEYDWRTSDGWDVIAFILPPALSPPPPGPEPIPESERQLGLLRDSWGRLRDLWGDFIEHGIDALQDLADDFRRL